MWMTTTRSGISIYLNSVLQLIQLCRKALGCPLQNFQIGRKLKSPMDKLLQVKSLSPSTPSYDVVHHLVQLKLKAEECCKKAQNRQLRSYNKTRREDSFEEKSRVWLKNFPQSSAQHNFTAKLAPKWKGPYRVLKRLGLLNYQIALEEAGEDV